MAIAAIIGGGAVTQPLSAEAATVSKTATTAVNVRSGPGTNHSRLNVLHRGAKVAALGTSKGWTKVRVNGKIGYVSSRYLSGGSTARQPSASSATVRTTVNLNLRTGPSMRSSVRVVAKRGTTLALTGSKSGSFSQVKHNGRTLWAASRYLSNQPSKPKASASSSSRTSSVASSRASTSTASRGNINRGGSTGLDRVNASAKRIAWHVWDNYPQIKTMHGWRRDVTPDHPAGRAVDVMIPNYRTNKALGTQIANYFRANAKQFNISYIIWDQKIWSVARSKEGWRPMANRGSDSANHKNHVHLNTY